MSKPKKVLLPYPNVVDQTCEDCKQDLSNEDIFYHYSRFHGHNPKSILSVAEYLKGAYNDMAHLRAAIAELVEALRPFVDNLDHSGNDPSGQCGKCSDIGAAKTAIQSAKDLTGGNHEIVRLKAEIEELKSDLEFEREAQIDHRIDY